jgi:phosphoribosylanthranilate isomerase
VGGEAATEVAGLRLALDAGGAAVGILVSLPVPRSSAEAQEPDAIDGWAIAAARLVEAGADALVVDTAHVDPGGAVRGAGGTGVRADWDLAAAIARGASAPVWLAGGLTPADVGEAIGRVRPFGVDVSGGVEAVKGAKDPALTHAFVDAVRRFDAK